VILPSHPFYGLKVTILQRGKTDTQEWCLITHPEQAGFHYRIPRRWLDEQAPPARQLLPYQNKEIALPFRQLQKLAFFIQCKFHNTTASSAEPDIVGSLQETITEPVFNVPEKRAGNPNDLVQHATNTKSKNSIEIAMGSFNAESKEQMS